MKLYNVIGSSSSGNAVLYHNTILVDCGLTYVKIKPYLDDIKIILLTHKHQDHAKVETISKINKMYPKIIWLVPEWLHEQISILVDRCYMVSPNKEYKVGKYSITPILLYHNVPNCGYRIITEDYKILHATDTATLEGISAKGYDLYAIEHNWDEETIDEIIKEKQEKNEYAYEAESRLNHLSIQKAQEFILKNRKESSEVVKLHISSKHLDKNSKYYLKELS